jgi:hypothetical protein
MIIAVIKESGVPNTIPWIDALGGGTNAVPADEVARSELMHLATMDAVLGVLLSRLQNLTSLYLGPNFTKETIILGGMLKSALCGENNCGLPNFDKLREVTLGPRICIEHLWGRNHNDQKPDNSLCSLTFFSDTAIEHITAIIEEPEIFQWRGSPPSPSTLTSLDLTCCRNLHTLAYHFYTDKTSKKPYDRVQKSLRALMVGESLMFSLALVKDTLKSLVLTARITPHDYDGHGAEPESIDNPISLRAPSCTSKILRSQLSFCLDGSPQTRLNLAMSCQKMCDP